MFSLNPNAFRLRGQHSVWTFTKCELNKYNFLLNPIFKKSISLFGKHLSLTLSHSSLSEHQQKKGVSCGCLRNVDEQKQMIGHSGQNAAWCRHHTTISPTCSCYCIRELRLASILKRVSNEIIISSL